MRKLLTLLVALSLAACGGKQPAPPASAPAEQTPVEAKIPQGPDRSGLPEPGETPEWAPPELETWTLSNGLEVWYLHQDQAPLVSIDLVLPQGAATDPAGKAGLTALMADMLDEGAGELGAIELQQALQRLATDFGASPSTDGVTVSMSMLADKLEPSLELLADILMRPKLPAEEFARRKAQHLAHALASEANPGNAATVVMRRALYGEGYGGMPAGGVRHTLKDITLKDVEQHYLALVKPEGATLVVVGDVKKDALNPILEETLGAWKGEASGREAAVSEAAPKRGVYFIDFPGSTQSTVVVARRTPGTKDAEAFASRVFNWVLGAAFTSRLNLNLREDKGYTYGARSSFYRWQDAGIYGLMAQVKSETTRASIDEMFKELREVRGERPLTEQEVAEAKGGLLLGFPGRFERMSDVAGQFAGLKLDARPPDWYRTWPEKIEGVGLEQANAAAKTHTDPEEFLVVIAGDREKLTPTLEDLGLPIFDYDAQGRPLTKK